MMAPEDRRKLGYGVAISVCILLGVVFTEMLTVRMFLKARAVAHWPTTAGTVIESVLEEQLHGGYKANVRYEYRVDGKRYESRQVRTRGTGSKYRSDAEDVVERFPRGAQPDVYYNPGSPENAYLEAGVTTMNYVIIVIPLLVGGAFLWAALGDWKTLRTSQTGERA